MKTIGELLSKYYLPGPFQIMKNDMLRRDLEAASVDPVIRLVNFLVKKEGNQFQPNDVVEVLSRLGVKTDDELIDFYNFMNSHGIDYLVGKIDMQIDIDLNKLKKIEIQEFSDLIYGRLKVYPSLLDSYYYFVSPKNIETITDKIKVDNLKYEPENRDCDDFTRIFRAELSRLGLGNLTVGSIIAEGFNGQSDKPHSIHSFIIFLTESDFICYDPKTKFFGDVFEIMNQDSSCKYAEIRSIKF